MCRGFLGCVHKLIDGIERAGSGQYLCRPVLFNKVTTSGDQSMLRLAFREETSDTYHDICFMV